LVVSPPGERRPKRYADAPGYPEAPQRARHRAEVPHGQLHLPPFASGHPSFRRSVSVEVLLAWSGRKFSCAACSDDLLPELRRRVLDEAGLRGEWGCGQPDSVRIVCRGRVLPPTGGGPIRDHVSDGSRLLVLGPSM
jgi:hypothetical protein